MNLRLTLIAKHVMNTFSQEKKDKYTQLHLYYNSRKLG